MSLRGNHKTTKGVRYPAYPARLNLLRMPEGGARVERVADSISCRLGEDGGRRDVALFASFWAFSLEVVAATRNKQTDNSSLAPDRAPK
jgi:hypothetical protein